MGCIKSKEIVHIDSISQQNIEPDIPVQHFIKENSKKKQSIFSNSNNFFDSCLGNPTEEKNNGSPTRAECNNDQIQIKNKSTKVEMFKIEDNYNIITKLNSGTQGSAFKVKSVKTNEIKFLKIVSRASIDDEKNFIKEIESIMKLEHPNISKLNEYFTDESNIYLITDFVINGKLSDYLQQNKFFNEQQTQFIMNQLLSAIDYLHNNNIIHCDINLDNILVDKITENQSNEQLINIKLTNIGIFNFVTSEKHTQIKEVLFKSPEVVNKRYSYKCDIWSCGVVMFYLLKGYHPFQGNSIEDVYHNIKNDNINFDSIPGISRHAKDLLSKMIERNQDRRFTASECMSHKWMRLFNERKSESNPKSTKQSNKSLKDVTSSNNAIEKVQNSIISYVNHYVGYKSEIEQLEKIYKQNDRKGNNSVSLEDIEHCFNKYFMDKANMQNFYQKNKIYKVLEGEYISKETFIKVAIEQEEQLNEHNLKRSIERFHSNKDGIIQKEEIKNVLSKKEFKYKEELMRMINSQQDIMTYDIIKQLLDSVLSKEKEKTQQKEEEPNYDSDVSLGYISEEKKANKFDREKFLLLIENEHTRLSDSEENAVRYSHKK